MNRILAKLKNQQTALGLCNTYPASGIIEGMCTGWDFVMIDGQHGQMDYRAVLHAVQTAAAAEIGSLVRVPGHESGILGQLADCAPDAVMVPMVNTPEQARAIVQALRFPPLGSRSYGGRRVIDLGGREYFSSQELFVFAQVETLEAVENAQAIASVEGIDGLFFGPDDMKLRMELPIDAAVTDAPRLKEAMQQTADACRSADAFAGCVAGSTGALAVALDAGYHLVVGGGDIGFLRAGAAAQLDRMRSVLGTGTEKDEEGLASLY